MLQTRPARLIASDELFLAIVRENRELRIERSREGELIVMPPAGAETSNRNFDVACQLGIWCRSVGGGKGFDSSAGFRLPDGAVRSPDAAWLESHRWAALSPEERRGFPGLCPDFVVELLSARRDLPETRDKMIEYAENGARLGWLIDPFRKAVEIYRPGCAPETREHPATLDGEAVLRGFVLDLSVVFAD